MSNWCRWLVVTVMVITSCIAGRALERDRQYGFSELFGLPARELLTTGNEYLSLPVKPDSALICFSILAERYSPSASIEEQRLCAMAQNNCGFIYYYFYANFPEAFNSLLAAQNLVSNNIEDQALQANIYLNLGNCYSMCFQLGMTSEDADRALEYYSKGYDLALKISNWPILLNCFTNIAMAPFMGDCPDYIKKQITAFKDVAVPEDTPLYDYYQLLYNTAVCILQHDYEHAIGYLEDQLKLYDTITTDHINRLELKADMLYGLAYCYQQIGESDTATLYANELIEFARKIDRPYYEALGYKMLIAVYARLQNFEKEKPARLRYYEIKDAIMSNNNLMMVDNLEFVSKLRQDNQEYIYKEQVYRHRMMILCGVVILLLVTLPLLWFLYVQNKKLRASYLALYERQQQMIRREDADRQARAERAELAAEKAEVSQPQTIITDTAELDEVKTCILNVLDHDQAIFDVDFSLDRLADLTRIKSRQLSTIINEAFGKNFYALLREYRIREACRRLTDKERYGNLTIEAISQSVGYKSRTSLVTAFKKETGLTPSEYQKIAKSQADK